MQPHAGRAAGGQSEDLGVASDEAQDARVHGAAEPPHVADEVRGDPAAPSATMAHAALGDTPQAGGRGQIQNTTTVSAAARRSGKVLA